MRSLDRYFSESPIEGDRVVLAGPEAHHLTHVMRGTPGTQVVLFDGLGAEFVAQIARVDRGQVQLSILERREIDRELPFGLTLAVGLPKGDRQKWLVEKAVELGVGRLVPLRTSRSVAQPIQQAITRLQRSVIEASKQCGRNRLMEIAQPQSWPGFVRDTQAVPARILAHPAERSHASDSAVGLRLARDKPTADPVVLAVGPEGGFTEEEVSLAAGAGWTVVDLGPRILRVETAAVFLVAMLTQFAKFLQ
jgi:16S rRNA (uracil1498-N3)-methyltransferase